MIFPTFNFKNHLITAISLLSFRYNSHNNEPSFNLRMVFTVYNLVSTRYVAIHFTLFSTAKNVYVVFSCGTFDLYVWMVYVNVFSAYRCHLAHDTLQKGNFLFFFCSAKWCHLHNCKYLINYQVLIIDLKIKDTDLM